MPTVRDRFRALHAREGIFVMPNPWDVGSARLMAHGGFEALATSSAGFAWSLGKQDGQVERAELVAHVAAVAAAVDLPLNVDGEHCFPDEPGGVAETVRLLADAGASGCSIEDWNPFAGRIEAFDLAIERVRQAVEAVHALPDPLVLTARCENHLHGVDDLEDTIARVLAYRDVGADCVFTPGLTDLAQIRRVVQAVGIPVNVVHFPGVPAVGDLERVGVRRVSTGSCPARAAYAAMLDGLLELREHGTSAYGAGPSFRAVVGDALT